MHLRHGGLRGVCGWRHLARLVAGLVAVGLVWVARWGVGIEFCGVVLLAPPEEDAQGAEKGEPADDAAYYAADCAAGETAVV
tara:strand:- start:8560 stop:8805 length:246 start_codon:yes stop_codon:yes gene_type:complete